jgi:hypothetical protein
LFPNCEVWSSARSIRIGRNIGRRIKPSAGEDLKSESARIDFLEHGFIEKPKSGNTTEMELRYTGIWGKRDAKAVVVHDPFSASPPED